MHNTRWNRLVGYIFALFSPEEKTIRHHIGGEYDGYVRVIAQYNEHLHIICDMIATHYHVTLEIPKYVARPCPDYRLAETLVPRHTTTYWQRWMNVLRQPPLDKDKIIAEIQSEKALITDRLSDITQIDIAHCIPQSPDFVASFQHHIQPGTADAYVWFHALSQLDTHTIVLPHNTALYAPHFDIMYQYVSQPRGVHLNESLLYWWHVITAPTQKPNVAHQNFLHAYHMLHVHIQKYHVPCTVHVHYIPFATPPQQFPWLQYVCTPPRTQLVSPLPSRRSRENRRFGYEHHAKYTISYAYSPSAYTIEHEYQNEDTLFFDIHNNDFFVIVCDGVSQACLSHIASQSVAQMMYISWQCLINQYVHYTDTELDSVATITNRFVQPALRAASHTTTYHVAQELAHPPESMSNTILEILRDVNRQGGSQSTFSCVFSYQNRVYCIWAGNSAIRVQNTAQILLDFTDSRFTDDKNRFSSHAMPDALYGHVYIEILSGFPQSSTQWRICIHSDALNDYPNREHTIYKAALERPHGRPLDFDDVYFEKCVEIDDATIIELYYEES